MDPTSVTLLARLRHPNDPQAWQRFVDLYTPLLRFWARKLHLQDQDAADLVQEVLVHLVEKMPEFVYRPGGSFRGWLRIVALNKFRESRRRGGLPAADSDDEPLSQVVDSAQAESFGEVEYRHYLVAKALEVMRERFQPNTWKACWEVVVADRPVPEVAAELRMSEGAVYIAKSRVLKRLREELAGLLD